MRAPHRHIHLIYPNTPILKNLKYSKSILINQFWIQNYQKYTLRAPHTPHLPNIYVIRCNLFINKT